MTLRSAPAHALVVEYSNAQGTWTPGPPFPDKCARRMKLGDQEVTVDDTLELALPDNRWLQVKVIEFEPRPAVSFHRSEHRFWPLLRLELEGEADYTVFKVPGEARFRWPKEAA